MALPNGPIELPSLSGSAPPPRSASTTLRWPALAAAKSGDCANTQPAEPGVRNTQPAVLPRLKSTCRAPTNLATRVRSLARAATCSGLPGPAARSSQSPPSSAAIDAAAQARYTLMDAYSVGRAAGQHHHTVPTNTVHAAKGDIAASRRGPYRIDIKHAVTATAIPFRIFPV
eukprot:7390425-Prymnesium_polylepis.1